MIALRLLIAAMAILTLSLAAIGAWLVVVTLKALRAEQRRNMDHGWMGQ